MTHRSHRMDAASLQAYRKLRPEVMDARISDILSLGITRTARELSALLGADLVSVRARLSSGCAVPGSDLTKDGKPPLYRKAVRVREADSRTDVWAYGLAMVPEVVA